MSIPSGMLIEKYNEKKMMIVAFIVSFVGSLLLALFPIISPQFCLCLLLVADLPCYRLLSIRCYAQQEVKSIMHSILFLPS
jgi:MFS family permease